MFMLVPPIALITMLPISIAGWGVREATMMVAFRLCRAQSDRRNHGLIVVRRGVFRCRHCSAGWSGFCAAKRARSIPDAIPEVD